MGLVEFLSEERAISRWKILMAGLIGMFCGAVITTVFLLSAVVG